MIGQDHAQQQRAEFRTQSEVFEAAAAGHQCHHQAVQQHQLAVAGHVQQLVQYGPQQEKTEHDKGPR